MRAAGDGPEAMRLRGLIIVLWRAGLRISEALALAETDLDRPRGAVLVRAGKAVAGGRSGWTDGRGSSSTPGSSCAGPCRSARSSAFCAARPAGGHAPRPRSAAQLHRTAVAAGVRRRFAPHQLRHAHAVEMSREGIPLLVIQRQLGHYAGDRVKRGERRRVRGG